MRGRVYEVKNFRTTQPHSWFEEGEKTDKIVISDDARQYQDIAVYHALCWIHEIRLYKKLNPLIDYHRVQLKKFLTCVWVFYDLLDRFRKNPNEEEKGKLETEFDELFFNRNRIRGTG